MKHLAIITDAWDPQINGVVRVLKPVVEHLRALGWQVSVIEPGSFRTIPCPSYPQIPIAINPWRIARQLRALNPDCIHIATEGPLGIAARLWCTHRGYRFTTSFHTRFAEYLHERFRLPLSAGYGALRWFHNAAAATLVPTPSLARDLAARGFLQCRAWTHGVDTHAFHPSHRAPLHYPTPVLLFVGRLAVEKNLDAFLSLDVPGTKLIVGDGPQRAELQTRYPQAVFAGMQHGAELSRFYASADVLVFPSRTETFGLVLLEALASGTPVAAYPVTGPLDIVTDRSIGALDENLSAAIIRALACSRDACRRFAERFSWEESVRIFAQTLVPVR